MQSSSSHSRFEILLVTAPGLEPVLAAEVAEAGFGPTRLIAGGVIIDGGWREVWRANLELRGAAKVLARIGSFKASHLAELDKRSRKFPWGDYLKRGQAVAIEATCKRSRIYHSGAAAERVATALSEEHGCDIRSDAELVVMVRIEDNLVTFSIDTSGELLHKRGSKQAMAKAPLRETLASLFLRQCGFDGTGTVIDPLCGSGTFVIEAAELAMGLKPGRNRNFAFEKLVTFDAALWKAMRNSKPTPKSDARFYGSDRDQGAITASRANAERAGVQAVTNFEKKSLSDVIPPEGKPGLVIMNPPYGTRISDKAKLRDLYAAIGQNMQQKFQGWRVGLITTDASLARATTLPFKPASKPALHGGLKVSLWQTDALS